MRRFHSAGDQLAMRRRWLPDLRNHFRWNDEAVGEGKLYLVECFKGPGKYRKNRQRHACGGMPRSYRKTHVRKERHRDRHLVWRLWRGAGDPEATPRRLNHRHSALWEYV